MESLLDLKIVTDGLAFPEGPVAAVGGHFYVVENAGGVVTRIAPDGSKTQVAATGGGPNGLAIGPDGALYVCNNGGSRIVRHGDTHRSLGPAADYKNGSIQRIDLLNGELSTLYTACDGRMLSAPNDIVFDAAGGFYFSDFGKNFATHRDHGAVYYALPDGTSIRRVIAPMMSPNGVGLSPDGKTLYVAETETARLWSFELAGPGEIKPSGQPAGHGGRLLQTMPGYHRFDSMAVQANGDICVATLVTGRITRFSPDGTVTGVFVTGDRHTTNLCFGGDDMRTAYITLSDKGCLAAAAWPEPGLVLNFSR